MSSMKQKGPAKTTPKHGKAPERRLYSKIRRGPDKKTGERGDINPDATISVAAVCGNQARIYDDVKSGRRLMQIHGFAHHGAAALFAAEHDAMERQSRARRQNAQLN